MHLVKSHSYSVSRALTSALCDGGSRQSGVPPPFSSEGDKNSFALVTVYKDEMENMIPLQKVNISDVNENKRQSQLL